MSPKLRGEEIMRSGVISVLPDWLQRQIARDKVSPRCAKCGGAMSADLRARFGHETHICCDPHDPVSPAELAACRPVITK